MSVQKKRYTSKLFREKTGVKPTQSLLDLRKKQVEIQSKITNSIKTCPKTVPEIATEIGLDQKTVLWYLTTFYKYNLISVNGKTNEGYYRYSLKSKV